MIPYLLGIDAGGTKTDFMLTDKQFNLINKITLCGANPVDIGIAQMHVVLQNGIEECCKGYKYKNISCFAGIAGGIAGNNKESVRSVLSQFGFGCFDNGSDIENCIAMTLGNADGICIIMGTGIVAFCQQNQKLHRIGGWGYLLDKGGSGYHLGADALYCALGCYDGRGGSEQIKNLLERQLNAKLPDAITEIYTGGKAKIASLAPIVFEAYQNNDEHAKSILDRNVAEVAGLIYTAFQIADNDDLPVFICGGLANKKDALQPLFKQHLPCCDLHFVTVPPVTGALQKASSISENGDY